MRTEDITDAARAKNLYEAPRLVDYGRVERLTMGNGGSSLDGTFTYDQRGGGNDCDVAPHGGGCS